MQRGKCASPGSRRTETAEIPSGLLKVARVVPDAFSDSATKDRFTTEDTEDTETNPRLAQEETKGTETIRFDH